MICKLPAPISNLQQGCPWLYGSNPACKRAAKLQRAYIGIAVLVARAIVVVGLPVNVVLFVLVCKAVQSNQRSVAGQCQSCKGSPGLAHSVHRTVCGSAAAALLQDQAELNRAAFGGHAAAALT